MTEEGTKTETPAEEILTHGMVSDEDARDLEAAAEAHKPNYYMKVKDEFYYVFND